MPVSPLKWNLHGAPAMGMEQVLELTYGTKRKVDSMEEQQTLGDCLPYSPEFANKRLCLWPQQNQSVGEQVICHGETQRKVEPTNADISVSVMDGMQTTEAGAQEQHGEEPPIVQQEADSVFPPTHSMDINMDDMQDYASAYDAMDGEGAVDPNQYGSRSQGQHEQHCFGVEMSPNSGNARCYCRPTWDTMLNTRSFYSDIY